MPYIINNNPSVVSMPTRNSSTVQHCKQIRRQGVQVRMSILPPPIMPLHRPTLFGNKISNLIIFK